MGGAFEVDVPVAAAAAAAAARALLLKKFDMRGRVLIDLEHLDRFDEGSFNRNYVTSFHKAPLQFLLMPNIKVTRQ